jgi:anti-sigma28 factor (negative regulator of flagellin synthesis)
MRITRRPPTTIPGLGETAPAADSAPPEVPASGGPITDRVQLSEAARLRQHLKREIGDPTATTSDRVRALRAQIANQTYAPSPRAIADRLLGELAANLLA